MSLKKRVIKIVFLTLIVMLLIILSIIIINKYFFDKEIDTSTSSKININDVSDNSKKTIKKEDEKKSENKEENVKEEQKDINVQDNKVENSAGVNIISKAELDNKKTEEQKPDSNNHNSSLVTPPTSQQSVDQTQKSTAPACTPKKFYTIFRADFTSEAECEATYNYYHNIDPSKYLGFICSYQADDCGVMYYMLTFFDSNGNYFGYNEI